MFLIKHEINAERAIKAAIAKLSGGMYQSSYETEIINDLKQALNEMQLMVGALPQFEID